MNTWNKINNQSHKLVDTLFLHRSKEKTSWIAIALGGLLGSDLLTDAQNAISGVASTPAIFQLVLGVCVIAWGWFTREKSSIDHPENPLNPDNA